MFDDVADAVRAYREAGSEHRRARDLGDHAAMAAAGDRLREIAAFLRARHHSDLIHPLTMEWVTEGRDLAAHERYRAEVEALSTSACRQ